MVKKEDEKEEIVGSRNCGLRPNHAMRFRGKSATSENTLKTSTDQTSSNVDSRSKKVDKNTGGRSGIRRTATTRLQDPSKQANFDREKLEKLEKLDKFEKITKFDRQDVFVRRPGLSRANTTEINAKPGPIINYLKEHGREKSRDSGSFFKTLQLHPKKILGWKSNTPTTDNIPDNNSSGSCNSQATSPSVSGNSSTTLNNHLTRLPSSAKTTRLDDLPRAAMRKKAKSFVIKPNGKQNVMQNVKIEKSQGKTKNTVRNGEDSPESQQFCLNSQFGAPETSSSLMFAPKPSSENLMAWNTQRNSHILKTTGRFGQIEGETVILGRLRHFRCLWSKGIIQVIFGSFRDIFAKPPALRN